MTGAIEALYIYDQSNTPIVQQIYKGRPPSSQALIQAYTSEPEPQPCLLYLPFSAPPTLLFAYRHTDILLLAPSSTEIDPLSVVEFLHRVVEVLEDFLGPPLLAAKIEGAYDVVAQLLTEMSDSGLISSTESNALREVVEVPGFVSRLLGTSSGGPSPVQSFMPQPVVAIPWRRPNVRHTNNEFYVDVVESLTAVIAPSGRPLAARANGSIACTSKITGIPDMIVRLDVPGGTVNAKGALELPVFHPCVRLKTWREQPGTLSFVPPDGRFVLAGYEVDLLPFTNGKSALPSSNFKLPVTLLMKKGLGALGNEFELRVTFTKTFPDWSPPKSTTSQSAFAGTSQKPSIENLIINVPLPGSVRNASDIRASRGSTTYAPGAKGIEWRIFTARQSKDLLNAPPTAVLKVVLTPLASSAPSGSSLDFETEGSYQSQPPTPSIEENAANQNLDLLKAKNASLMPSAAVASFQIRGWLPSGVRVGAVEFDPRKSKAMGQVKPYKGVRYLCVSEAGIETRC